MMKPVFAICLCIFVLVFIFQTASLSPVARYLPLLVSVPTFLLLTWLSVSESRFYLLKNSDGRKHRSIDNINYSSIWLLVPVVSVSLLGFMTGLLVFLICYLHVHNKESLRATVFSTILAFIVLLALSQYMPIISGHKGLLF